MLQDFEMAKPAFKCRQESAGLNAFHNKNHWSKKEKKKKKMKLSAYDRKLKTGY